MEVIFAKKERQADSFREEEEEERRKEGEEGGEEGGCGRGDGVQLQEGGSRGGDGGEAGCLGFLLSQ